MINSNSSFAEVRNEYIDLQKSFSAEFSALSEAELNTKPNENTWSIGEVLEHLMVTNTSYFVQFDNILAGNFRPGLWQKINPFTKWMGKKVLSDLSPEAAKKFKVLPAFKPVRSTLPANVLNEYLIHTEQVLKYMDALQNRLPEKTVISSPAAEVVTYTVQDALRIITIHTARHLQQALRVKAVLPEK